MAESVSDVRSRKPTAAGPSDAPAPIGVPEDYVPPAPGGPLFRRPGLFGAVGTVAAGASLPRPGGRYYEGDEIKRFAGLSVESRAKLQRAMERAGIIPKGTKYQLGVWDQTSQVAAAEVMGYANQWGVDFDTALHRYAEIKDQYGPGLEPAEPLVLRPTNPEDVRAGIRAAARRIYGKGAPADLIERLTQEWLRAEEETQRTNYATDQSLAAGAMEGTAQSMPSLETFAENRLRQATPEAVSGFEFLNQANAFRDLLSSTSGNQIEQGSTPGVGV